MSSKIFRTLLACWAWHWVQHHVASRSSVHVPGWLSDWLALACRRWPISSLIVEQLSTWSELESTLHWVHCIQPHASGQGEHWLTGWLALVYRLPNPGLTALQFSTWVSNELKSAWRHWIDTLIHIHSIHAHTCTYMHILALHACKFLCTFDSYWHINTNTDTYPFIYIHTFLHNGMISRSAVFNICCELTRCCP